MRKISILAGAPLLLLGTPAFSHVGHAEHGSFIAGFLHPLSGVDHTLAMVAISGILLMAN